MVSRAARHCRSQATTEMTLLAAAMFYVFFQDIGNLA
jgi:hypothetical protein